MPKGTDQTSAQVQYRCVCGQDAMIDLASGGQCKHCQRDISADMLRSNVSQTIDFSQSGSRIGESSRAMGSEVASTVADEKLIGETLGHYRVVSVLGHGGMGTVYRALDESLQRYVAIKVLKKEAGSTAELDRLMQEARAQARVNHPNITHIYYVSRTEERPFLAMELVNGPTLANRMRDQRLAYPEIVRIAIETTQALRQSARFDIVHGDIKPSNILLEENKQVKLSDFGLARRISQSKSQSFSVSGTPAYMAPEITLGSEANVLSDQYSLGVMLFQLTFARLPYTVRQDSVTAMIKAHQQAPVEFPKPWPKDLPDEWKLLLSQLLAKDPADRFANYDALGEALRLVRPLNLPKAGFIVRGLAWTTDVLLAVGLVGISQIPTRISFVEQLLDSTVVANILMTCLTFVGPILAVLFQMRWRTSLAKKVMQIRIVDEHGLTPSRFVLGLRAVVQYAPVWATAIAITLDRWAFDEDLFNGTFSTIYGIFIVITVGVLIFSRRKISLHDRIFGTRVCLDAGSTEVV